LWKKSRKRSPMCVELLFPCLFHCSLDLWFISDDWTGYRGTRHESALKLLTLCEQARQHFVKSGFRRLPIWRHCRLEKITFASPLLRERQDQYTDNTVRVQGDIPQVQIDNNRFLHRTWFICQADLSPVWPRCNTCHSPIQGVDKYPL
jgi:hypothetical protein